MHTTMPTLVLSKKARPSHEVLDGLIGRCLAGRFLMIEPIGQGAYGRVFRAAQIPLYRDVAIKVLDPALAEEPGIVDRFYHEAFAAGQLHHPNTVTILDVGKSEDGWLYIAMEYVPGLTLTELIETEFPLALPRVVDIMGQILLGLEESHACGVVHADLKSDNILVEPLHTGELVKLVDFGISRLVGRRPDGSRGDAGGHPVRICGTPGYIAPEVIQGQEPGPAADIYAAGVILHQLLTGHIPFSGTTPVAILRSQLAPPASLMPSCSMLPERLAAIVARAMARDTTERYRDAAALRAALAEAAAGLMEEQPEARTHAQPEAQMAEHSDEQPDEEPEDGPEDGDGPALASQSDDGLQLATVEDELARLDLAGSAELGAA